ncbi:hypothetical protein BDZ97DRAFT_1917734 [Flammula alnicola]|nr:hypothetical protein BDZ97DRAFT_1917734 [Flammula alnicola]
MRAEGVKPSRAIFAKARRDAGHLGRCTKLPVCLIDLMEYHCTEEISVASRIFERAWIPLGRDRIRSALSRFLISINDKNNARALFERVIPTSTRASLLKLEKRMAEVYSSDPPIKRLAQRHIYLGTDAIADRDLGFAIARRATTSSHPLMRTETSQSLMTSSQTSNAPPTQQAKRPASPDYRKREEGRGVQLPNILSWFIGELPTPSSFDGPVFRTDDLMNLFRNAVIPSTSGRPKSPPPPRSGGGRPPPDYGPYQGPTGGRGRRY